jgi:hypothetical protein
MKFCIILRAFLGYAKHMVCLADFDEACGCCRIVAIMVRMILLREGVELALDLSRSCSGC